MDDVKRAIAFLFRRAGAVEVPEKDLLLAVSLDLRWFNYTTAERLIALAAEGGLVRRAGGRVRLAFEAAAIEVPLNYSPPPDLLAAVPPRTEDLFHELLGAIAGAGKMETREALARVNAVQDRQDVTLEVAALLVLAELGGDARRHAPRVLDHLRRPADLPGA